jgi:hypothetical protein
MDVARCCICCNGCTYMLQGSIPNVLYIFFRRMLQACLFGCCIYFHTYVESVLSGVVYVCNGFKCFCKYFSRISVSYFFLFYVASAAFECFKSKSCVTHVMRMERGRARGSPRGRATCATFGSAAPHGHDMQARASNSRQRGPMRGHEKMDCNYGCADVRALHTRNVMQERMTMIVPTCRGISQSQYDEAN